MPCSFHGMPVFIHMAVPCVDSVQQVYGAYEEILFCVRSFFLLKELQMGLNDTSDFHFKEVRISIVCCW